MKYLLIFITCLIGCGKSNVCGKPQVLIFGDSLAADPSGFAVQFANRINKIYYNGAQGGSRLEQPIQYSQIMSNYIPSGSIVIFQPGINDAFAHGTDPGYIVVYENMLRDVINKIEDSQAIGLIGTTSKILNPMVPDSTIKLYGDKVRKILSERYYKYVHFVDIYNNFVPGDTNMADVTHPNILGASQIAEEYVTVYQSILITP